MRDTPTLPPARVSQQLNGLSAARVEDCWHRGRNVVSWISDPTVAELSDLVCGRVYRQVPESEVSRA
jgi:hypothetical protein